MFVFSVFVFLLFLIVTRLFYYCCLFMCSLFLMCLLVYIFCCLFLFVFLCFLLFIVSVFPRCFVVSRFDSPSPFFLRLLVVFFLCFFFCCLHVFRVFRVCFLFFPIFFTPPFRSWPWPSPWPWPWPWPCRGSFFPTGAPKSRSDYDCETGHENAFYNAKRRIDDMRLHENARRIQLE